MLEEMRGPGGSPVYEFRKTGEVVVLREVYRNDLLPYLAADGYDAWSRTVVVVREVRSEQKFVHLKPDLDRETQEGRPAV